MTARCRRIHQSFTIRDEKWAHQNRIAVHEDRPMYSPRLKTLETCALATGGAFVCHEDEGEPRYVALPSRAKKVAVLAILAGFFTLVAGHHFGFTKLLASLPGLRAAV
jgi:hypothetical protein